jgi:hypothetical protein
MVIFANGLPISVSTEIELQKQPQDESEAKPAKTKGAKVGADGSPLTLSTKMKSKELKQQQAAAAATAAAAASASPAAATATPQAATTPANNTPSIIKFISKMSNKNIKLVQVGNESISSPSTTPAPIAPVVVADISQKKKTSELAPAKVKETKSIELIQVDVAASSTSPSNSTADRVASEPNSAKAVNENIVAVSNAASLVTPGTPHSPKVLLPATSSGTAEKRCK